MSFFQAEQQNATDYKARVECWEVCFLSDSLPDYKLLTSCHLMYRNKAKSTLKLFFFFMGTISICEMLPLVTKEHSKARPPNTIPSGIHGIHTPQSFTVCSLFIASQCLLMFLSPLGYLWYLFLVFLSMPSQFLLSSDLSMQYLCLFL